MNDAIAVHGMVLFVLCRERNSICGNLSCIYPNKTKLL